MDSASEVVDQEARDAVARRKTREVRAREPAGVLEFLRIDLDVAACVGGEEADHELAREGPVLAPDVGDVLHVHADLFLDLTRHAALERFAVVDEAGDQRVAAGRPDGFAGEQHAIAVAHDHDDSRVQVRVVLVFALRTALAPLAGEAFGGVAAARAEAARRFPPERLHGHAAEREQVVGQSGAGHRYQRLALEFLGHHGVARQRPDPAFGVAAERAEPDRLAEGAVELRGPVAGRKPKALAVGDDDELLILDDEPLPVLTRRFRPALGRNERAAQAIHVERQVDGQRRRHDPRSPTLTGAAADESAARWPGESALSFWSAGMTSRAKRRMFRSASAYGIPA